MAWQKTINVSTKPNPTAAYVPSWWLERREVEPGDNKLVMFENDDGDLVIRPVEKVKSQSQDCTQPASESRVNP